MDSVNISRSSVHTFIMNPLPCSLPESLVQSKDDEFILKIMNLSTCTSILGMISVRARIPFLYYSVHY